VEFVMPAVTRISEQKRRPNRRNIYLDGKFAFGCNLNVVAKFRLREGMNLSPEQVTAIQQGEVRQECFDAAMKLLQRRMHSRVELQRKLMRKEYGDAIVNAVLDDLARLGYVDDERFARTKALSAAQHKQHGRRRAFMELIKSGVKGTVAGRAVEDVYDATDTLAIARQLAQKRAPSLRKLDPLVARRRLVGMLQRRGFNYDDIRPVIDEVLGYSDDAPTG
jgi:regulatory protein